MRELVISEILSCFAGLYWQFCAYPSETVLNFMHQIDENYCGEVLETMRGNEELRKKHWDEFREKRQPGGELHEGLKALLVMESDCSLLRILQGAHLELFK
jgi:hypothetical protein